MSFKNLRKQLQEDLKDKDKARDYLNSALEDEDLATFLCALMDVLYAQVELTAFAASIGMNRGYFYKHLNAHGNPSLADIMKIMKGLGYHLVIRIK